jgi:2-polyprenyl-6-methoxyphenol hydroxylase-like FAD-dependent oxidoreductase
MNGADQNEVTIVGGGIAGLALALNLHARAIPCRVYEAARELREIGVGITVLPHAMHELAALGLQESLIPQGIENRRSRYFNRFGQMIYEEPRGRFAGYPYPELGVHRGRLHGALYRAVQARLGADAVITDRQCVGLDQDGGGTNLRFRSASGEIHLVRAETVVACDGVNSAVRAHFYPEEPLVFAGINSWRGVTCWPPILDGRTYLRIGSIRTGKMTIYPIADGIDADGRQLINWVAQLPASAHDRNDWNRAARPDAFIGAFRDWVFDWLDAPAMIEAADAILEYPMVDRDPIPRWTFGRVTLAGDAAHPMYPRGSNGSAQALIDVRVLADLLAGEAGRPEALAAYEATRRPQTRAVVLANRSAPPDLINTRVEELTGDKPFADLDDFITQPELRRLSEQYERTAQFTIEDVR